MDWLQFWDLGARVGGYWLPDIETSFADALIFHNLERRLWAGHLLSLVSFSTGSEWMAMVVVDVL